MEYKIKITDENGIDIEYYLTKSSFDEEKSLNDFIL